MMRSLCLQYANIWLRSYFKPCGRFLIQISVLVLTVNITKKLLNGIVITNDVTCLLTVPRFTIGPVTKFPLSALYNCSSNCPATGLSVEMTVKSWHYWEFESNRYVCTCHLWLIQTQDGLYLPVVSDMQYSGLSWTPIVAILKHEDLGKLTFELVCTIIAKITKW